MKEKKWVELGHFREQLEIMAKSQDFPMDKKSGNDGESQENYGETSSQHRFGIFLFGGSR